LDVRFLNREVDWAGGHPLAGRLDSQGGIPFQVFDYEVVEHLVHVMGFALHCDGVEFEVSDGLFRVSEPDVGHVHCHVVLLPPHVEQFTVLLGSVEFHRLACLVFHLADRAVHSGGGLKHLAGHDLSEVLQIFALDRGIEFSGLGTVVGLDVGICVLEVGWSDGRVPDVESGGNVAVHVVEHDGVVTGVGALDVGFE